MQKKKPKMVNAPEGLNQVTLRKVRRFRCLFLFAKNNRFWPKNIAENVCQKRSFVAKNDGLFPKNDPL